MPSNKVVYTAMVLDHLHHGHLNIINESRKKGKVILGLLTDEAVASYKRVPTIPYEKRKYIAENIAGIWKVVPQKTLDYIDNLDKYKPDVVVNGDDWKQGIQVETRQRVVEWIERHKGELIEIPYTKGISSTQIIEDFRRNGITPDQRMPMLRRMLNVKPIVRVIEAHNGLSGLVAENAKYNNKSFDAIWESSLTDSTSKGKPDIELVDFTSRVQTINEILEVTTKPLIVDGDTGGQIEHFKYIIRTLERLGVSAIIIEDKKFPKINSLKKGAKHIQEDPYQFCKKIEEGKKAQMTEDFMIIARVESLIAGKTVEDALSRAALYLGAGVDGIMIHSKEKNPDKIFEFCKRFRSFEKNLPLIVVPTTYNSVTEEEFIRHGANMVIYANHLLRTSYKNMIMTANDILIYGRAKEVEGFCCPVEELFKLTNR